MLHISTEMVSATKLWRNNYQTHHLLKLQRYITVHEQPYFYEVLGLETNHLNSHVDYDPQPNLFLLSTKKVVCKNKS